MMQWGYGFGGFWMLIWWVIIIGIVVVLLNGVRNRGMNDDDRAYNFSKNPLDILKERYAKGELTEEEYKKMRRDLQE
jgi:putative membrane protein